MRFPILPILFLALNLSGCAQHNIVLPPGEDAVGLEAAIASKGSRAPQPEADVPHRNVIGPVLETGAKVGETCAVIGTAAAYAVARRPCSGIGSAADDSSGGHSNGVSDRLHEIWSEE